MAARLRDLIAEKSRYLWLTGIGLVVIWIGFVDSHSLLRRATWYYEAQELKKENEALQAEIYRLNAELETDLTDEQIERIAREEYGMQRPEEVVHPVVGGE